MRDISQTSNKKFYFWIIFFDIGWFAYFLT